MCFSATASFIASGGLTVVGGASVHAASKSKNKRHWLIAMIPIMFAIQQAFEGVQWLSDRGSLTSTIVGYGFLFFAFILWPIYVPLSVYIFDRKRRHIHQLFVVTGVAVALYLLMILATQPLSIRMLQKSIDYRFDTPYYWVVIGFYVFAACGAPMSSTNRFFRWLGVLGFVTAAIAETYFIATFASVWCFFAAIMSVSAYIYLCMPRFHFNVLDYVKRK